MVNPHLIYYGLSAVMLFIFIFIYTIFIGIRLLKRLNDYISRKRALGIILFVGGATIILLCGIFLLLIDRARIITVLQYQMIQYSIFYLASGSMLYGTDAVALAARNPGPKGELNWRRLRVSTGILFIISIVIAGFFLYNPSTYTITQVGSRTIYAQQQVFYLPLFYTLAVSFIGPSILAWKANNLKIRNHLTWYALASLFVATGLLRESRTIPSSGNQIIDNLIVFMPLTIGAFCLFINAKIIQSIGDGIRTASESNCVEYKRL